MFGDDGYVSASEEGHRVADSEGSARSGDATRVEEAACQPRRRCAEIGAAALGAEHSGLVAVITVVGDAVDIIFAVVGVYIDTVAGMQAQCGSNGGSDKYASVSTEGDVRAAYRLDESFHNANI